MKVFLSVLILIFSLQSLTKADDISELLIEEMSVGDSLLQYMSVDEINEEFSLTKNHYVYLSKPLKYREAYLYKNFENYDVVSFFVNQTSSNAFPLFPPFIWSHHLRLGFVCILV